MSSSCRINRRRFLATIAAGMLAPRLGTAADGALARFPIIAFSKPFQNLNPLETADLLAEIGYDGIECPVRKNGQVLPARVEDDLPKMHDALSKFGLALTLITTDIAAVSPLNEKVLRTAAKLGVKRYRLTSFHYDLAKAIPPQLAQLKPALRDLAGLNRELGISGGIQNHSGSDYIGAPLWDLHDLLKDIDPKHLGVCFDIGHATLEGGYSWPIQAKLIEPLLMCVYVKDFAWQKKDNGSKAEWRPLGEGSVSRKFFAWLKTSSYRGPISQHCEYLHGSGREERAQMKKDLAVLKEWLRD